MSAIETGVLREFLELGDEFGDLHVLGYSGEGGIYTFLFGE